jgi:hypothetical protein
MADSPNVVTAGARMVLARRLRTPSPSGDVVVDHSGLQPVLDGLASKGIAGLPPRRPDLERYRDLLMGFDPDDMGPAEALAYWVNLYNAGALFAAIDAIDGGEASLLRVPGVFSRPWVEVAGERLSLDDIEHGKVRRFGDPRVHAALVCGSVSCPTLRREPFTGDRLDRQFDDQMRRFLAGGAASIDRAGSTISLSRIFLWFGRDFIRPDTMPAILPADPELVRDTVAWWLPEDDRAYVWDHAPRVEFLAYDWALACTVA